MSYIRKRGNKWRAEVEVVVNYERLRDSATFNTKAEAVIWSERRKRELRRGDLNSIDSEKTFKDAILRYLEEKSPLKASYRTEKSRISHFLKCSYLNTDIKLDNLNSSVFEKYIHHRCLDVMTSTVNKEISIMRSIIRAANKWRWIDHNPFKNIKRLKEPPPRNRRISDEEIEIILSSLGYSEDIYPAQSRQRVAIMFLLALETAMRIGEICNLDWRHIYLDQQYLTLLRTKNGDMRDVPLSLRAVKLLEQVRPYSKKLVHDKEVIDEFGRKHQFRAEPVFYKDNTYRNADAASSLFKKYVKKVGIENLTFHDTRHEACTRLALKIDVLDLAKIIGHRDPSSLMIYYNPTASEIASRLD